MNIIELNFSGCKYINEVHDEIKNKLDFPEHYGRNLDALWDCLDYYTDEYLIVKIFGFLVIEKLFDDYSLKIKEIFKRVSVNCPNIKFEFLS